MPCYVITHQHFGDADRFRDFQLRLAALARQQDVRLHPLGDAPLGAVPPGDEAVMLEFRDARAARTFMCSQDFRAIACGARAEAKPQSIARSPDLKRRILA